MSNQYQQGGEFRQGADYPHKGVFYSDGDGETEYSDFGAQPSDMPHGVSPDYEWRKGESGTTQPGATWPTSEASYAPSPAPNRSAFEALPWRILKAGTGWFLILILVIVACAFLAGAVTALFS